MKMIPWKSRELRPGRLLENWDGDMDSFLGSFFGNDLAWPRLGDWVPRLDMTDGKDEVTVKADLPGMKKDEIQVSVDGPILTISGERVLEEKMENGGWRRMERSSGSFSRSVTLPSAVSNVRAEYKDGVLTVHLEKDERSKSREIKID
jgi:HSP20 family protein